MGSSKKQNVILYFTDGLIVLIHITYVCSGKKRTGRILMAVLCITEKIIDKSNGNQQEKYYNQEISYLK